VGWDRDGRKNLRRFYAQHLVVAVLWHVIHRGTKGGTRVPSPT
jgi:hypothetical protein